MCYHTDERQVEHGFRPPNDPDEIVCLPMYCWTDNKNSGVYALICVLALLVPQLMNYRARQVGLSMSNAVPRAELSDIHGVILITRCAGRSGSSPGCVGRAAKGQVRPVNFHCGRRTWVVGFFIPIDGESQVIGRGSNGEGGLTLPGE